MRCCEPRGGAGARLLLAKHVLSNEPRPWPWPLWLSVDTNLHSPERHLIELRMEHADLQASLQRLRAAAPLDELAIRRLEKRGLQLRDQIARLELVLDPK